MGGVNRDADYLAILQDYYARHRVLPPYSKIQQLLGFRSKSPVAALVERFKARGWLAATPERRLIPGERFFERALAQSAVQAGLPNTAEDPRIDGLAIDAFLVERPSRTTLITVKGDSMIDAGIHPGDIVVVERGATAQPGDIVVAIVDDEFTLKILDQEKGRFVLRPANPAYPVIRPKGALEIFGIVVGQFRKYRRR